MTYRRLIPANITVRGVSIWQKDDQLIPQSDCCDDLFKFKHYPETKDNSATFECACGKTTLIIAYPYRCAGWYLDSETEEYIQEWTGLKDVKVNIEWT